MTRRSNHRCLTDVVRALEAREAAGGSFVVTVTTATTGADTFGPENWPHLSDFLRHVRSDTHPEDPVHVLVRRSDLTGTQGAKGVLANPRSVWSHSIVDGTVHGLSAEETRTACARLGTDGATAPDDPDVTFVDADEAMPELSGDAR